MVFSRRNWTSQVTWGPRDCGGDSQRVKEQLGRTKADDELLKKILGQDCGYGFRVSGLGVKVWSIGRIGLWWQVQRLGFWA